MVTWTFDSWCSECGNGMYPFQTVQISEVVPRRPGEVPIVVYRQTKLRISHEKFHLHPFTTSGAHCGRKVRVQA